MSFCSSCGAAVGLQAVVCIKCGVALPAQARLLTGSSEDREWLVVLLLCFFLGIFGIHRFYTRHTTIGVVQLLTLGGCGIWALIDFILIVVGNYKDANGQPLRR